MISKSRFYIRILSLLAAKKIMPPDIIKEDYNSLAAGYDQYFSKYTALHSQEMVRRLSIEPEARVLDLACGTGVITAEICKYVTGGDVTAVDFSQNMIEKAREKVADNVKFINGDMLQIITCLTEDFFDYVTCGWAIGYSQPAQLISEIKRVLRRDGKVGIIENRYDTLAVLRDTGLKVMQRHPAHIQYLMDLPFRLPRNKEHVRQLYEKAGLKVVEVWDGEVLFRFKSGREALHWSLHTGASAGFDRIMDPKVRKQCDDAFVEIIERDHMTGNKIEISHRFVAGIARKS